MSSGPSLRCSRMMRETACPLAFSASTSPEPTKPVEPVTAIRILPPASERRPAGDQAEQRYDIRSTPSSIPEARGNLHAAYSEDDMAQVDKREMRAVA